MKQNQPQPENNFICLNATTCCRIAFRLGRMAAAVGSRTREGHNQDRDSLIQDLRREFQYDPLLDPIANEVS